MPDQIPQDNVPVGTMQPQPTEPQPTQEDQDQAQKQEQEASKEQIQTRQQQELDALKARQEQELTMADPMARAVDQNAFDATFPRGPEAPLETLKPSQRQGQGIVPPPDSPQPVPPVLERPQDPASEVTPETPPVNLDPTQ